MSPLLEALARRVDFCHSRFETTGEQRWLNAAVNADRMYRRAKERTLTGGAA